MTKKIVNLGKLDRYAKTKAELNKKAERKLYWTFEPDGGDNTPLTLLEMKDRAGFLGGAEKIALKTNKDGVCEHDYFQLSCAGKDKFKVSVSLKPDGSGKSTTDSFEVWRQIHVSIKYMDPAFVPDLGPVNTEYHKHGTIVQRITPPGGEKVAHVEKIEKKACFDLMWPVTKSKLEARVLLVDRIRSETWAETVVTTSAVNTKLKTGQLGMPTPNFIWEDDPLFARATVTGKGISVYDITPYLVREGDRVLRTEIPDTAAISTVLDEALKRGPLTFKFNVRFAKYPNGFAREKDGFIVIANRGRTGGPKPAGPRQGTMIHEMGHGFGLVKPTIQEYDATSGKANATPTANSKYYDRGSGGHCKTGAGGTAPNYENGTCVMFHAGHSARPHAFCPDCAKLVKRANLLAERMPWPSK